MAAFGPPPLFEDLIPTSTTRYVGVPVCKGAVGVYVGWKDATSSATITLELTSVGDMDAPVDTAGTWQWKDSGLTFTGPAASAVGALLINVDNVRQRRARLKIVTAAPTTLVVHEGASRS